MPRSRKNKEETVGTAGTAKTKAAVTKTRKALGKGSTSTKQRKAAVHRRSSPSSSNDETTTSSTVRSPRPTKARQKATSRKAGQEEQDIRHAVVPQTSLDRRKGKQRHRSGPSDDNEHTERQLSSKSVAKWQVMPKRSQQFISQIADNSISTVLSETRGASFNDVQDHLNNLKRRLMTKYASLKVPNRKQPNYDDMGEHANKMETAISEISNQVERLDKEVELQERLVEEKEEELENLEAGQRNEENCQDTTDEVHPLLRGDQVDVLAIPPLRRITRQRGMPSDVRSCQQQQQFVDAIFHRNKEQGTTNMADYLDAVSTLQKSLPT